MNHKTFEHHYRDQLTHLKQSSKEFASHHPILAPLLLESSTDPDIERLLQGNAYLNAIIQKKLEDDFPEFLYELIDVFYPHYLKPIPSMSVIEFKAQESVKHCINVPQTTLIKSQAYEGVKSPFQTTWDLTVHPLDLKKTSYNIHHQNSSSLTMELILYDPTASVIDLTGLSFFINDEKKISTALCSLLMHYLESITVTHHGQSFSLPKNAIENLGLNDSYSILPYPKTVLHGYRMLQEYFSFESTMMFFQFKNNPPLIVNYPTKELTLTFNFTTSFSDIMMNTPVIKLNSVPSINLFEDSCEPIKLLPGESSLTLTPSWQYQNNFRIYDVKEVIGVNRSSHKGVHYIPFNQFSKHDTHQHFYKIRRKKSHYSNNEEVYLHTLVSQPHSTTETLCVNVQATNGTLPQNLRIDTITLPTQSTPPKLDFTNITVPTAMIESPIEQVNLWPLITHSTINILGLKDLYQLKQILVFYIGENSRNTVQIQTNKQHIDAISDFNIEPSTYLYQGSLIKGHTVALSLNGNGFLHDSAIILFAHLLHKFFELSAPMNTPIILKVYNTVTGKTTTCNPQLKP